MTRRIFEQLAASELAHIVQCMFQSFCFEVHVKKNGVKMSGHNDIRINSQVFILNAIIEAVRDDFTSGFINKDWQPFHDREVHII